MGETPVTPLGVFPLDAFGERHLSVFPKVVLYCFDVITDWLNGYSILSRDIASNNNLLPLSENNSIGAAMTRTGKMEVHSCLAILPSTMIQ